MTDTICIICHAEVPESAQTAHLASEHPSREGGFVFHVDAKPYRSDKPSMTVTELLTIAGTTVTYHLYQTRIGSNGEDVFVPQGCSVDLTQDPWFYAIPPATY